MSGHLSLRFSLPFLLTVALVACGETVEGTASLPSGDDDEPGSGGVVLGSGGDPLHDADEPETADGGTTSHGAPGESGGASGEAGSGGASSGGSAAVGGSTEVNPTGGTPGVVTGTGGGTGGSGETPEPPVPPRVLSSHPTADAVGVPRDEPIQLAFSTEMNRASVENHFSIDEFEPYELEFTWSTTGTEVAVRPRGGFEYAEGTDPDWTTALSYHWTLASEAVNLDGTRLATAATGTLSTLRRIVTRWEPQLVTRADTYGIGNGGTPAPCPDDFLRAGTFKTSSAGGTRYVFVSYAASDLGDASAITSIEEVRFRVAQLTPEGDFYETGRLLLDRLAVGDIALASVLDLALVQAEGVLAQTPASQLNLDITPTFPWGTGQRDFVYRLSASEDAEPNTAALLDCDGFRLDVTYLIP